LSGAASNLHPSQIVAYEDIKTLPNHPEKLLVDVREPDELEATGKIPTSINIPSKYDWLVEICLQTFLLVKTLEESLKLTPEEFLNKYGREKPTTETEMIFHCKGGGRGGRATELALSLGFVK
jgi:thiosulfate:glutathione sulfurtransferase